MELKPLFVFPRWANTVTLMVLILLALAPIYVGALVGYGLDPVTLNVGYQPVQPVAYSHALHAGELGLDCRYCHNTVEKADFAALPPTETCMNCHRGIWPKSEKLAMVRDSFASGRPIPWRLVTTVPDYVYFSHAAHVNTGVSCVECHGQVNHMEVVYQAMPMNMAWCLQCHRDPMDRLRPRDQVTNLDWKPTAEDLINAEKLAKNSFNGIKIQEKPGKIEKLAQNRLNGENQRILGEILKEAYQVNPITDCITCHR